MTSSSSLLTRLAQPRKVPRVLSIAGTDPTGGAGIQADLKSIAATGGYGMAVVTALVAQNTCGVRSIHVPPMPFLREQLDSVSDDVVIDAVKIGMLGTRAIIDVVRDWLIANPPPVVVLDPVMVATSGDRLLDAEAETALRELLHRADLITPNMPELAVLANAVHAQDWCGVLAQAREVAARYNIHVLAKGGHLDGAHAPDALVAADGTVQEFPGARIATRNTHGTGCSYSAALACLRPQTDSWAQAVALAKPWLTSAIRHADALNVGKGNGPIHHFADLWEAASRG
ncbi:phosphomethylpyrimidine kinase [Lampropedia cohaerens]|uniref:hydroxymethylpyrimidine kinase n=1 Tax=Lampropedia cohaerens TaxID=1610491 RepID=A0A0U1Q032_9BURK|nr:bifunctional hydroxymethylpyrimidine kinase/phosphomethylpyrimidine kinase [Lampropedia cohaerens]KKW68124.1 phosphomethylpyrimidine kinase [Lampropedia cohaerens]